MSKQRAAIYRYRYACSAEGGETCLTPSLFPSVPLHRESLSKVRVLRPKGATPAANGSHHPRRRNRSNSRGVTLRIRTLTTLRSTVRDVRHHTPWADVHLPSSIYKSLLHRTPTVDATMPFFPLSAFFGIGTAPSLTAVLLNLLRPITCFKLGGVVAALFACTTWAIQGQTAHAGGSTLLLGESSGSTQKKDNVRTA